MKQNYRATLAGLVFVAALIACTDDADRIVAPTPDLAELRSGEGTSAPDEQAALSKIGRLVAMSLDDRKMRHRLKNDLRAARFKEHKLELRGYLRSADGKDLLRGMAGAGNRSTDAVLTTLDQIRSLELYMPVRKHRESWVGDGDLIVAVQLEEDDPILAFNGRGRQVPLDASTAPSQPTLSIVASETRFDQPMASSSRNVGDLSGQAIGTLVPVGFQTGSLRQCEGCLDDDGGGGGGGGGGAPPVPPGLYLEFSRILDAHEPWTRGDPEIEVHIQGPTDLGNPKTGEDLSCSGEHAYDYRKVFDQNGGFWQGRVMLFSADETTRFNEKFSDGFHVLFWEDDDATCILKLDNETLIELLKSSAAAYASVALRVPAGGKVAAALFLATLFTNPGAWLRTNDDFLGAAVPQEYAGYNYPGNTHVLMKGTRLNGRLTLVNY